MARQNKRSELKQVKMTDEIREKLYGFSIVSGSIIINYKLDLDIPEEFIPSFKLKTLTLDEVSQIKNADVRNNDYFESLVRTHICGWSNLYDLSTGELVEFEADDNGNITEELYESIPTQLKLSIIQQLTKLSNS